MRPLHIGLLVVGAALAGGLALKMTEQPAVPVASVALPQAHPEPPRNVPAPDASQHVPQPPQPIVPQPPKPSPLPAPETVTEPVPYKITPRKNEPKSAPAKLAAVLPVPPPYSSPKPDPSPTPASVPEPLPVPPRQVTARTGTTMVVRIDELLSSDSSAGGDTFSASLAEPLVVDGLVIAERGARVSGRVVNSHRAGPSSGASLLELRLSTITTSDGQRVAVSTESWTRRGDTWTAGDAATIGGGAAVGAIVGAIEGGGKGAAIGAGVGGVAGLGTVAATRGRPVTVPSETIIRFRLASAVTITERR